MSVTWAAADSGRNVPWTGPTTASGSVTMGGRFFPTAALSQQHIILDTSGGATAILFIDDNGGAGPNHWAVFFSNDTFTIFAQATSPNVVVLNAWIHVVGTWDGTSTRLYENGVLVATVTPAATTRAGNWSNWLSPAQMDGSIQDVVGYNAALNVDEIAALSRSRNPERRANLMMFIPSFTTPGLDNFSGVGPNLVSSGGVQTAGPDTAGIPWGTAAFQQQPVIRLGATTLLPTSWAVTDVETGTMTATALLATSWAVTEPETATAAAGAALAVTEPETAAINGASAALSVTDVETAAASASAAWAVTDRETGAMAGATGALPTAGRSRSVRRPPNQSIRRALRW